ncbi:7TM chemoreceptor [Trichostrongylus colubriformis]|uniref:7TM chemoreceptor n=1 Tax=Trichostrongylus colubriformis TaxID=6319 RepID=A0AAN8I9E5_TRICO
MHECYLGVEPRIYITVMQVLSAITLPVDLFGVYCIITKTPPTMKQYSRLLLLYQISATASDTWMNMMSIPVLLHPFPIFYHAGLILPRASTRYPYLLVVWMCLITTAINSVVLLFVFRYLTLRTKNGSSRIIDKCLYATCIIFYILCNSGVIIAGFKMPNRIEELKSIYVQDFTCIEALSGMSGIHYVLLGDLRRFYMVPIVAAFLVIIATIVLLYLTFHSFRRTNVSQKTIEMQKKYQFSLILQVIIPISVVLIPGCSIMALEAWSEVYFFYPYTFEIQGMNLVSTCLRHAWNNSHKRR